MLRPPEPLPMQTSFVFARAWRIFAILFSFAMLAAPVARAQPVVPRSQGVAGRPGDAGVEESADAPAPDSPRASVTRFLELCRAGAYSDAAQYLELGARDPAEGPELARKLKAVLDRNSWLDLDTISARPLGDEADGLARG